MLGYDGADTSRELLSSAAHLPAVLRRQRRKRSVLNFIRRPAFYVTDHIEQASVTGVMSLHDACPGGLGTWSAASQLHAMNPSLHMAIGELANLHLGPIAGMDMHVKPLSRTSHDPPPFRVTTPR